MSKVLVTGGNGYVGTQLNRCSAARGPRGASDCALAGKRG